MSGEPQRVGSGTFRIDRKRALELLARYGLESPLHFPLPWIRAAVGAGAGAIEAIDDEERFALAFDGRPYAATELSELLSSLPDEAAESRLRELARGTASALVQARRVTIRSGRGADRVELAASREEESVAPADDGEPRTVIAAVWPPGGRPAGFGDVARSLGSRCVPGLLSYHGEPGPAGRLPAGYWQPFREEHSRGWLSPPAPGKDSELFLYQLGVSCGRECLALEGHADVRAIADDPSLGLDLSQGLFVKDDRWRAAVARVGRAADAFACDAARRLGRVLPRMGDWLRDPVVYARWKACLTDAREPLGLDGVLLDAQRHFALDAGTAEERIADIERWAPIVAWLRRSAGRLLGAGASPATELERALWTTPLYLTVEGLPVSVEELERLRLRFGRVTVAERRYSGEPALPPAVPVADRRALLALLSGPVGDRVNP